MSEDIEYVDYEDEDMLPDIQRLVSQDLSEPYSIYTYRFFLHNWPSLCTCVYSTDPESGNRVMIATIVSKAELEGDILQGYIAMLAVDSRFRGQGIGSKLARINIDRMAEMGCQEIVLEAEVNFPASPCVRLAHFYICSFVPSPKDLFPRGKS